MIVILQYKNEGKDLIENINEIIVNNEEIMLFGESGCKHINKKEIDTYYAIDSEIFNKKEEQ